MKTQSKDPCDRLETLNAIGAIKAWIAGDFSCGEESLFSLAIRRDTGIDLSDSEIKDVICDAIDDDLKPLDVLEHLLKADVGSEGINPSSLNPR